MNGKVGFAMLVGLAYAAVGLGGAFGVTSADFWSGVTLCLAMLIVLPLSVFAIWNKEVAGRLLVADGALIVGTSLFQVGWRTEALISFVVGYPVVMSGFLLLKATHSDS